MGSIYRRVKETVPGVANVNVPAHAVIPNWSGPGGLNPYPPRARPPEEMMNRLRLDGLLRPFDPRLV